MYFQCVGRKVEIAKAKGGNAEFYGTMEEVEGKLNNDNFWRIHKSYIVNASYILEFRTEEICLTNGEILPVSRRRSRGIQERILEEKIRRRK
jgi:Response regulator of the LytR/AlgR family